MQAIIFTGIQAAGKSTFFKMNFFDTHLRISLDLLKTRHREKIFLNACLETGLRFVVDNTNPTIEERKKYIEAAKSYRFEVVGYYFESRLSDAIGRNLLRTGRQHIPEKGIRGTLHRLQRPSFSEGFDRLYYVKINTPGEFSVTEWIE